MNVVVLLVTICGMFTPFAKATISLRPVSTVYIPYRYQGRDDGVIEINSGAVKRSAFDIEDRMAYTVGRSYIHVVDFSDVIRPKIVHFLKLRTPGNDIAICGDYVAIVQDGPTPSDNGTLVIYDRYRRVSGGWNKLFDIAVGSNPGMLRFTSDCRTVVVANEGQARENGARTHFINPEGTVSIARLTGSIYNPFTVNHLDFTSFNHRGAAYETAGVRWPYKGQLDGSTQTMSQNLEPEFVTFNKGNTKAFVTLQENNAVAIIDLVQEGIVEIVPLGTKSWRNLMLDVSDEDLGTNFRSLDLHGLYQPKAIEYMDVRGKGYLITANQGAPIRHGLNGEFWKDHERGEETFENRLISDVIPEEIHTMMSTEEHLGRLRFSLVDNVDNQGKIERLNIFGGRGISVWDSQTFKQVFDSGDEIERQVNILYSEVFNANSIPATAGQTPGQLKDQRSDDMGPECVSLELAELNGRRVLFVGINRVSAIAMYSFSMDSPIPKFESIFRGGGLRKSFGDLLLAEHLAIWTRRP